MNWQEGRPLSQGKAMAAPSAIVVTCTFPQQIETQRVGRSAEQACRAVGARSPGLHAPHEESVTLNTKSEPVRTQLAVRERGAAACWDTRAWGPSAGSAGARPVGPCDTVSPSDLDQHVADVHVASLRRGVQWGSLVLVLHFEVGVDPINCGQTGSSVTRTGREGGSPTCTHEGPSPTPSRVGG